MCQPRGLITSRGIKKSVQLALFHCMLGVQVFRVGKACRNVCRSTGTFPFLMAMSSNRGQYDGHENQNEGGADTYADVSAYTYA